MSSGNTSASELRPKSEALFQAGNAPLIAHFLVSGVAEVGLAGAPKSGAFCSGAFLGASPSQPIAKLPSNAMAIKARKVRMRSLLRIVLS
jgi:hypothetical protein